MPPTPEQRQAVLAFARAIEHAKYYARVEGRTDMRDDEVDQLLAAFAILVAAVSVR